MGRSRRGTPLKLAGKLQTIRVGWLRLSQTEMAKALGLKVHYTAISHFELGTREPSLEVLLKYARIAGISMEVLVDDKLNLPDKSQRTL
jgi:transcriptional regulator with XRE-family HTH domain